MRHGMSVRLDLRQQTGQRHHFDDALAGDETIPSVERRDQPRGIMIGDIQPVEERQIAFQLNASFRIQDIDLSHAFGFVTLADFEIVEVVRRRNLDRAGALFRVRIFVGDNCDKATDERQAHAFANKILEALIFWMNRDAGIAEHSLGTRRRDSQDFARRLADGVDNRVIKIKQMPARIAIEDLAQRGDVERLAVGARPLE